MERWKDYILYRGKEQLKSFLKEYYSSHKDRPALFFVGKGFDPRMMNALRGYLDNDHARSVTCYLIGYESDEISLCQSLVDENYKDLLNLVSEYKLHLDETISTNYDDSSSAAPLFYRSIIQMSLTNCDFFVDISSMPRSLYYTILKALYNKSQENGCNLFVFASENIDIDNAIVKTEWENMEAIWGFKGKKHRGSIMESINILLPLLGEGKSVCLEQLLSDNQYDDVCPVLPFPSKDANRSERILWEYSNIFSEKLSIESQNITYAQEQNPFELYAIINSIIQSYTKTFKNQYEHILFEIALLTSKLLSLGAFLVAIENPNVAVLNVNAKRYELEDGVDENKLRQLNANSEVFLMWITGEAYGKE